MVFRAKTLDDGYITFTQSDIPVLVDKNIAIILGTGVSNDLIYYHSITPVELVVSNQDRFLVGAGDILYTDEGKYKVCEHMNSLCIEKDGCLIPLSDMKCSVSDVFPDLSVKLEAPRIMIYNSSEEFKDLRLIAISEVQFITTDIVLVRIKKKQYKLNRKDLSVIWL